MARTRAQRKPRRGQRIKEIYIYIYTPIEKYTHRAGLGPAPASWRQLFFRPSSVFATRHTTPGRPQGSSIQRPSQALPVMDWPPCTRAKTMQTQRQKRFAPCCSGRRPHRSDEGGVSDVVNSARPTEKSPRRAFIQLGANT